MKKCPNPDCDVPLDKHTHIMKNVCQVELNDEYSS